MSTHRVRSPGSDVPGALTDDAPMTNLATDAETLAARGTTSWGAPPTRTLAVPRWVVLVAIVGAEVLVALASSRSPQVAAAHALLVTLVAGYALLKRDLVLSACVLAYLPGSEVLWRQARASIPYQWGPYLAIGISLFCLVLVVTRTSGHGKLALLYIGLLAPGALITISTASGGEARNVISFALAGPLALAVGVALLSQVRVARWLYRRLLWVMLIGTVGPLAFAVSRIQDYIVNTGEIDFATESNFVTSGGFGPVQVSSILGLGVLAAILLVIAESALVPRLVAGSLGLALAVQSLLTFSRGGMFSVAIAAAGLTVALTRDRANRTRVWVVIALVLTVGYFVVIPRVDAFTEGAFKERFTDTQTSRTDLAANDFAIFRRNVLFGVGPGMTKFQRLSYDVCELRNDDCDDEASSHTEFTRSLGEHGLLGAGAVVVLAVLAVRVLTRRGVDRAVGVTFMLWAGAQMLYANLRIVAVPVAFALAFMRVGEPEPEPEPDATSSDPGASQD